MLELTMAALAFAALHLLVSGTRLRDVLVGRLGERAYAGAFSLASAVLLGWMIYAYVHARVPAVTPLHDWRWLAAIAMFIAFVLIVLGLLTPGATVVGGEKRLKDEAHGIHRVTRHPFLWGMALWALVHLVYNPGLPHLVFFGCFALVAFVGTFSIDGKRARRFGELWPRYAALTSNLPFAAIAQGRNHLALAEIGWWRMLAAVAAFVVVLLLHARLFGVPAL